MKNLKLFLAIICYFFLISSSSYLYPCTAFMIKSNQGVVTGRSLDYNQPSVYNTKIYKKGDIIQSVLGNFSWTAKNDFITINNVIQKDLIAFEGMNKYGISISGNLADADYPNKIPHAPTLSTDDIVRYILALASNISDARDLFSSINISSKWQYHYIIFDNLGNSLMIEFKNGEVNFANKTQILTNNPDISYQLANLNIYANLKNYNSSAITPDSGNQFHGQGMFGLPGDWTSPSRFVRAYFMIQNGSKYISTQADAVIIVSKILESVSLIKGIDLGKTETSAPIYTQIQIIKDIANNTIYLKRYDEFQWTKITY